MTATIHIIGCGTCRSDLTASALETVQHCDVLYGGKRMLNWFDDLPAQKIPLTAEIDQELRALVELSENLTIGILASGDSLFFGIAARLRGLVARDSVCIHPGISAMQAACAHFKCTWEQARFFSLHGRDNVLPWRQVLQSPLAVIYGDHRRPANVIAAELIRSFPSAATRPAYAAENLGAPNQRTVSTTLDAIANDTFAGQSLLIVQHADDYRMPPLSLGLSDSDYERESNLITHPEIRAVVLAKLQLHAGTLWDLGAGSGSVGIEAAGLVSDSLQVHSVEKDAERAAMINHNVLTHGLNNLTMWLGTIADIMPQLPDPTFVFAGGGGREIGQLIELALQRLRPGGRLVATAILADSIEQLSHTRPELRQEWLEISIRRSRPLAHSSLWELDNPIHIFVFKKPTLS